MPTTAASRQQRQNSSEYTRKSFELLVSTLKTLGCDPHRARDRHSVIVAACPLPGCASPSPTPLQVDTRTARYHCNGCNTQGTPTAFAARLWLMSASQAHALIEHYDVDDMLNTRPPLTREMLKRHTDTFPIGLAMGHYAQQLDNQYPPLQWLTKLGIAPDAARKANLGYSTGEGLMDALSQAGLSDKQIEDTHLRALNTGQERLAGNLVLADTDHTGAPTWIVSTNPAPDNRLPGYDINPNLPRIQALPFRNRSAIIGLHHINQPDKPAIITDDFRAYAAAATTEGVQALLLVQRTRNEPPEQRDRRLDYTAENIASRSRMAKLVVATHDPYLAIGLSERLSHAFPNLPVLADSKALTLQIASATSRNFPSLFDADTFQERATRSHENLRSAAPLPASNMTKDPNHTPEAEGENHERTDNQANR